MILTSDLHLTDNAADEYRWQIFEQLKTICQKTGDRKLFILGDICDRVDRHSAALVNRLMYNLVELRNSDVEITCLLGNHDMPISGPPYWNILNQVDGISFVTQPSNQGNLILLPYTPTPAKDWESLQINNWAQAIFMHQTVNGAVGNNGHLLQSSTPTFPDRLKVYSGDIHVPQVLGNVTYVGAPHHVNFGDSYPCRVLQLDNEYNIAAEFALHPPRKLSLDIHSFDDLEQTKVNPKDQLKIKVQLRQQDISEWPQMKQAIERWASAHQVSIASIAAIVTAAPVRGIDSTVPLSNDPETIFQRYCARENLDQDLVAVGLALLQAKKE